MWQELRAELHPQGLEVVTVALDTGGVQDAGEFIDAASPEHPSLIDSAHLVDELLGIDNVPMAVWIDEEGTLVRPPEVAHPGRVAFADAISEHGIPEETPSRTREMLTEAMKLRLEPERYAAALRDWVARGPDSPYALAPDEVVERSRPRPLEASQAAAEFELAQCLTRRGDHADARPHYREAHRLDRGNWTYKRQAWVMEDSEQGPSEHYDSDWLSDVRESGIENYYRRPEL